ncbi:MAG TPA: hypothetical protein DCL44_07815 [Elusimicrobia bacterium]|nr:hypothetical protein [Elusimicrobiota bacterium]
MKCPNCGFEETDGALECSKCSVIFAKLIAKQEKQAIMTASQPEIQAAPSYSTDYLGAAIKYAVIGCVFAILFLGGRAFIGWFGGWFKTAQNNAPAARQAAMQSINIPKVNLSQTVVNSALMKELSTMQNAQTQAMIKAAISNAQQNAAVSEAVKQYQSQPVALPDDNTP